MTEPRIPYLPIQKYPLWMRFLFRLQRKKFGAILNPSYLWGYTPKQFLVFTLFYLVSQNKKSTLHPGLRSLVMVRVAQIHGCQFCIDINALLLMERTQSQEKFLNLSNWKSHSEFSELEKAALEYAEAMTQTECQVTEELMTRLKTQLTDTQIIELTGLIAYQNMSARFNSALNIPPQGFCDLKAPQKKNT